MLDTICTLPLTSDLFALTLHPHEPILTVGLSSGHVQTYRLPASEEDLASESDEGDLQNGKTPITNGVQNSITSNSSGRRRSWSASENGLGSIETVWRTRRHKGSCRCLAMNFDGSLGYSAGTDGMVKSFSTETGKVLGKIAIPLNHIDNSIDAPTALHTLSPQSLLLATDSGKLYVHDLRIEGREIQSKAAQTWNPHVEEHVSSITPLPASKESTSGFPKQWISAGGTTIAVTDLRKGILATSEDQETELVSISFVQGLKRGGTSVGEKLLVGQGDGALSLWEKGVWDDLDERIVVDKDGSVIEVLYEVPYEVALGFGKLSMNERLVAAGLDDGRVRFVKIGTNGVLSDLDVKHDEIEGVTGLGFDVVGRMVTGGGQTVKIWTEAKGQPGGQRATEADKDSEPEDSSDADSISQQDSESEELEKKRRKKRKRNKGKDQNGGKALDFSGLL